MPWMIVETPANLLPELPEGTDYHSDSTELWESGSDDDEPDYYPGEGEVIYFGDQGFLEGVEEEGQEPEEQELEDDLILNAEELQKLNDSLDAAMLCLQEKQREKQEQQRQQPQQQQQQPYQNLEDPQPSTSREGVWLCAHPPKKE